MAIMLGLQRQLAKCFGFLSAFSKIRPGNPGRIFCVAQSTQVKAFSWEKAKRLPPGVLQSAANLVIHDCRWQSILC